MIFAQAVQAAAEVAREQRISDQVLMTLITQVATCVVSFIGASVMILTVWIRTNSLRQEYRNSAKIHSKKMDDNTKILEGQNEALEVIKQKVEQPITVTVVDAPKTEAGQ